MIPYLPEPNPPYPTENRDELAKVMGISKKDRVLDIGGGHNPFIYANVVVDIDFHSGIHRDGIGIHLDMKKYSYVQADITSLPFKDKSFDFVFCIQVLEHTDDPGKACEELMRVAHRGFIETPRKWTELYGGYPTHKWMVDDANGIITFEPITFDKYPFMNFLLPPIWSSPSLFENTVFTYRNVLCVQLKWSNRFNYQIINNSRHMITDAFVSERHFHFAYNILYWLAFPSQSIFHAKRAYELVSDNQKFLEFYAFHLALTGKWRLALKNGLSVRFLCYAALSKYILKCNHILIRLFRRILSEFK